MNSTLQLALKPGEKIYLNGAVIRVDRRVRLEVLNDAVFLLGAHVLQPEEAASPLRQLYFAVQSLLIEPDAAKQARHFALEIVSNLEQVFTNAELLDGLDLVRAAIGADRPYAALKIIRNLYALEDKILDFSHEANQSKQIETLPENAVEIVKKKTRIRAVA